MSEKEQPPIMDQKLCVNGCGFFGSSNTSHMCSKCWKDTMSQSMRDAEAKKDGAPPNAGPLPPLTKPAMEESSSVNAAGGGLGQAADNGQPAPPSVSPAAPAPPAPVPGAAAAPPLPPTPPMAAFPATPAMPSPRPVNVTPPPQAPEAVAAGAPAAAAALPLSPVSFSPWAGGASMSAGAAPAVGGGGGAAGAAMAAAVVAAAAAETPARPVQKNRKRCFTCSKKVGYTGIACRCNYVFCSLHRYPEQHDCTFDFKTSDRNDLKRTVVGGGQFSKVERL